MIMFRRKMNKILSSLNISRSGDFKGRSPLGERGVVKSGHALNPGGRHSPFPILTIFLLFSFVLFNLTGCDSNLSEDLETDFNANYTFFSDNPSESEQIDFVTITYPIGSKIYSFPTSKDPKFSDFKPGYKFDKWFYCSDTFPSSWEKNEDGTVKSAIVTSSSASFYVAQWNPIEYDVIFNANGGTGDSFTQHFVYGESQKLSKNTFTKDNYAFAGWGHTANQPPNYIDYEDEAEIKNITTKDGDKVNLYALWLRDKVTITFNGNGGIYKNESGEELSTETQIIKFSELPVLLTANKFSKEGHSFSHWNTKNDGTGVFYSDETEITTDNYPDEDTTFYAQWQIDYYTVTFNKKDGSGEQNSESVAWNTTVSKPADPVRTGYDFKGWFTSNDGGSTLSDTAFDFSSTIKADTTLYAKWEVQSITIKFNANASDVTQTMADRTILYTDLDDGTEYGKFIALDCEFDRTASGLMFVGWSNLTDISTGYGFVTWGVDKNDWDAMREYVSEDSTITFYAQWDILKFWVTFDTCGGKWTDTEITEGVQIVNNQTVTKPKDPVNTGYDFAGWYIINSETSELTNTEFDFSTPITKETRLWAKWNVQNTKIKYDSNGGTGSIADQTFSFDALPQNITANSLTYTGYDFKGWAKTATGSVIFADSDAITSDNWNSLRSDASGTVEVTLYAIWEIQKFKVSFVDAISLTEISSVQVEYNGTISLPSTNPTKEHYTFLGWDDTNSNATAMESAPNLTTPVTSDVTIWAKWTPDTYTLTFDGNGATGGSMSAVTFTYGQPQNLPANTFTRGGYNFTGWGTSATSTDIAATDGKNITIDSDTTYYAIWAQRASISKVENLDVYIDEENEQIVFTAKGSYVSYSWTVTGTPSQTFPGTTSITLPFNDYADNKNHFVLLIGVDENGESSTESANFKIAP